MRENVPQIEITELIESELRQISLPSLVRPPVSQFEEATEALVHWGMKKYAFSSLIHVRTVLAGVMDLAKSGNQPTMLIVGRHVFEWAMHSSYVAASLDESLKTADLKKAWALLLEVNTGNSWVRNHGRNYLNIADSGDVPSSVRISKLVKAYEKFQLDSYGSEDVQDSYGYLSEHAHANAMCFQPYLRVSDAEVNFVDAPKDSLMPGVLHIAVINWLMLTHKILTLAKEDSVRSTLHSVIRKVVAMS